MESYLNTVERTEILGTDSYNNSWRLIPAKIQFKRLLARLYLSIKSATEYACGIYLGAFICLHLGFWIGCCYAEHIKEGYLYNCIDLGQAITYCSELPFEFARIGKLAGVVAGAVAIAVINNMLLCRGIISFYKKNVKDPKVIAQALGTSKRQVQRKINKLIRRKKIGTK